MCLRLAAPAGLVLALAIAGTASARTVDIELLVDQATGKIVFAPAYLRLETGDKLRFEANGPGRLVGSIAGMLPDGVAPLRQQPGKPMIAILDKDGVYGFACLQHYADGVVALYLASKPANEGAAKTVEHPAAAARRFADLFAKIDAGD